MPLRIFETNLESVKPEIRSLYVPDVEHGFRLDLSDLDEHVAGLKSALRKCRDELKTLRAAGGMPGSKGALSPVGEMLMTRVRPADVKAGLLPRRGTP